MLVGSFRTVKPSLHKCYFICGSSNLFFLLVQISPIQIKSLVLKRDGVIMSSLDHYHCHLYFDLQLWLNSTMAPLAKIKPNGSKWLVTTERKRYRLINGFFFFWEYFQLEREWSWKNCKFVCEHGVHSGAVGLMSSSFYFWHIYSLRDVSAVTVMTSQLLLMLYFFTSFIARTVRCFGIWDTAIND